MVPLHPFQWTLYCADEISLTEVWFQTKEPLGFPRNATLIFRSALRVYWDNCAEISVAANLF